MAVESAGLLMYKKDSTLIEVFLVHPGGPFFKNKDDGWWTIPKGSPLPGEQLQETAIREFKEETGISSSSPYFNLGFIKQKGGKIVHAWAFEGSWDPGTGIKCNTFEMEWPPKSGKNKEFPEVDRALWLPINLAYLKINEQQKVFLSRLEEVLLK